MKSAVAVVLLAVSAFGIPSSLLEDVKIAKMTPARSPSIYTPNKVKRSQEVFMYGDQQSHFPLPDNYQRDMRFPRTNKRDLANMQYYSAYPDQRLKRTPTKRRSLSRVRSKRDSDIDPRELLPALLLALSEEKLGMLGKNRGSWNSYYGPDVDDGEWTDNIETNNQFPDLEDLRNGGEWLDGPVIPSVHQLDDIPPSRHWDFQDNNHKRFMVSKRFQNRDEAAIAQLFNNNRHWDYDVPVYRRPIL